jgi:HNH endonuclease/NUMOD4 motif
MKKERWAYIFSKKYAISSLGRLRRVKTGKILKISYRSTGGYGGTTIYDERSRPVTVRIHKLVAENFTGPCPLGMEVDHEDGNKKNNEDWNLKYKTSSQNHRSGRALGLWSECANGSKLTIAQVKEIRRLAWKETLSRIAIRFGVTMQVVSRIKNRKTWAHV